MNLLITLIIGGVAGWLAGMFVRGNGYGVIVDILLGLAGAWLGSWLGKELGFHLSGNLGYFITAFAGAVILVCLVRLIKKA